MLMPKGNKFVEESYNIEEEAAAASLFTTGNGYIGVRGSFEEFGSLRIQGAYIRGVIDEVIDVVEPLADNEYMKKYYFDEEKLKNFEYTESIINNVDFLLIKISVNGEIFYPWEGKILKWERYIDLTSATLTRKVRWENSKGDITDFEFERFSSFDCEFVQNEEFYKNLKNSWVFESEKNKLSYDMEIEPIYLIGDFGVKTEGEWTELDRNAVRYSGEFIIDKLPDNIAIKNIEQQGFPFFCGELELEGEIDVEGENPVLELDMKGVNAVRIEINDMEKTMLTDNRISLSDCERGRQKIKLTLINNLRNLLGPHHLKNGECYYVGPFSFYKENCIWNGEAEKQWDDDYCLVEFGCI